MKALWGRWENRVKRQSGSWVERWSGELESEKRWRDQHGSEEGRSQRERSFKSVWYWSPTLKYCNWKNFQHRLEFKPLNITHFWAISPSPGSTQPIMLTVVEIPQRLILWQEELCVGGAGSQEGDAFLIEWNWFKGFELVATALNWETDSCDLDQNVTVWNELWDCVFYVHTFRYTQDTALLAVFEICWKQVACHFFFFFFAVMVFGGVHYNSFLLLYCFALTD